MTPKLREEEEARQYDEDLMKNFGDIDIFDLLQIILKNQSKNKF